MLAQANEARNLLIKNKNEKEHGTYKRAFLVSSSSSMRTKNKNKKLQESLAIIILDLSIQGHNESLPDIKDKSNNLTHKRVTIHDG